MNRKKTSTSLAQPQSVSELLPSEVQVVKTHPLPSRPPISRRTGFFLAALFFTALSLLALYTVLDRTARANAVQQVYVQRRDEFKRSLIDAGLAAPGVASIDDVYDIELEDFLPAHERGELSALQSKYHAIMYENGGFDILAGVLSAIIGIVLFAVAAVATIDFRRFERGKKSFLINENLHERAACIKAVDIIASQAAQRGHPISPKRQVFMFYDFYVFWPPKWAEHF